MAEYIKIGVRQELKICPICKIEKWMKLNQKVCPGECAKINNKLLQKICRERRGSRRKVAIVKPAAEEYRELTNLTEKLICIYNYVGGERNTVKQIAEDLSRPVEQVKSILREAVESGRYEKYIKQLKKHHNTERGSI